VREKLQKSNYNNSFLLCSLYTYIIFE